VKSRHYDLCGRSVLRGVLAYGNATAIVADGDAAILTKNDLDRAAEAGDGFVDGVVDHLVDEMMKPIDSRAADVHGRPFPDRIEAFEDLNGGSVVAHAKITLPEG